MDIENKGAPRRRLPARPAHQRRSLLARTARLLGPLAMGVVVFMTQPAVLAACIRDTPAFPPGTWKAELAPLATGFTDNSTGDFWVFETQGEGSFVLTIQPDGQVSGSFAYDGVGEAEADSEDDWSAATWEVLGELDGTPSLITIDGTMDLTIGGEVDVSPGAGPDDFSGSGQANYDYGLEYNLGYSSEFSALSVDCNSAYGEMTAPVGFPEWAGQAPTVPFYAVRVGAGSSGGDIEGQLVDLLEEAEAARQMDPADPETFDTAVLANFLKRVLQFDAVLVSLESCNPDGVYQAGPAWEAMRNIVLQTVTKFAYAAQDGAYETADVIRVMAVFLQSGILAWGEDTCIDPMADDSPRQIWRILEGILVERLGQAIENGDTATVNAILAAAHQFGLVRIIEIMEGGGEE